MKLGGSYEIVEISETNKAKFKEIENCNQTTLGHFAACNPC